MKFSWIPECTFRDTMWKPDFPDGTRLTGEFVDFARLEFEAKIKGTDKWRHFSLQCQIPKTTKYRTTNQYGQEVTKSRLTLEQDVFDNLDYALTQTLEKGVIEDGGLSFEVVEFRASQVPDNDKEILMKNRGGPI